MFDIDTFALYGVGSWILARRGGVREDGSIDPGTGNAVSRLRRRLYWWA